MPPAGAVPQRARFPRYGGHTIAKKAADQRRRIPGQGARPLAPLALPTALLSQRGGGCASPCYPLPLLLSEGCIGRPSGSLCRPPTYGAQPAILVVATGKNSCRWTPLGVRGLRRGLAEAATGAAAPALCPLREATAQGAGSDAGCGARGSVDSLGSRLGAVGARGAAGPPGRVARRGGAVGGRGREAKAVGSRGWSAGSGKRTQPEPGFRSRTGRGRVAVSRAGARRPLRAVRRTLPGRLPGKFPPLVMVTLPAAVLPTSLVSNET